MREALCPSWVQGRDGAIGAFREVCAKQKKGRTSQFAFAYSSVTTYLSVTSLAQDVSKVPGCHSDAAESHDDRERVPRSAPVGEDALQRVLRVTLIQRSQVFLVLCRFSRRKTVFHPSDARRHGLFTGVLKDPRKKGSKQEMHLWLDVQDSLPLLSCNKSSNASGASQRRALLNQHCKYAGDVPPDIACVFKP